MGKKSKFKYSLKIGKTAAILLVAVVTVVLMFTGFVSFRRTAARFTLDFYYPYLSFVNSVENSLAEDSLRVYPKEKLVSLVSLLMKQNAAFAANADRLRSLEDENNRLRSLLDLEKFQPFTAVSAEIISRDPATWNEQFVISRGSDYGILPGAAVVAPVSAGSSSQPVTVLVGRVSEVSAHSSIVTSVRSERCQISVYLPTSRTAGSTIGQGGGNAYTFVSRLPVNSLYTRSERVETSNFSELVPGGILVGYLLPFEDGRIARPERGGLFAEARLLSAVQFDKLRFVSVLVRQK